MTKFKQSQLQLNITKMLDYSQGIDGFPKSDVLKFFLEDGCWFAVRPSGTESKIKFYFGSKGTTHEGAQDRLIKIKNAVLTFFEEGLQVYETNLNET